MSTPNSDARVPDRAAAPSARRARRQSRKVAIAAAIGAVLVGVLLSTGCSKYNDDRGIGDAPVDQQPDRKIKVWPAPDKFMNVGAFCIGQDAVYIHTRTQAPPVVVGDSKNCDEGGVLKD